MIVHFLAALMMGAVTPLPPQSPEVFAPGLLSTGFDDAHIAFSQDGQDIYFLRNSPDFRHWTILLTHPTPTGLAPPAVADFSGQYDDGDVFVTQDGQRLYFMSNRPERDSQVTGNNTDIWRLKRQGAGWGMPQKLAELSSPGDEWFPTLTRNGTVYFGSERDGGHGKSDLWRARPLGDGFGPPENLGPVINSDDQEIEPLIDPEEQWLIFAARGHGTENTNYDLFISYNCDGNWTKPTRLGAGINSEAWDFGPRLSPDGGTFFFTSNRATGHPDPTRPVDIAKLETWLDGPGNGLRDIYRVSSDVLNLRKAHPCLPSKP